MKSKLYLKGYPIFIFASVDQSPLQLFNSVTEVWEESQAMLNEWLWLSSNLCLPNNGNKPDLASWPHFPLLELQDKIQVLQNVFRGFCEIICTLFFFSFLVISLLSLYFASGNTTLMMVCYIIVFQASHISLHKLFFLDYLSHPRFIFWDIIIHHPIA